MDRLRLLPVGISQTLASVETWLWYARSPEVLQPAVAKRCAGCARPGLEVARSIPAGLVGAAIASASA
jgi:hypothetical protein